MVVSHKPSVSNHVNASMDFWHQHLLYLSRVFSPLRQWKGLQHVRPFFPHYSQTRIMLFLFDGEPTLQKLPALGAYVLIRLCSQKISYHAWMKIYGTAYVKGFLSLSRRFCLPWALGRKEISFDEDRLYLALIGSSFSFAFKLGQCF